MTPRSLDPVVRTTAAEVRKRLIQYYYNTDHLGELIIELPVGSYIPSLGETSDPDSRLSLSAGPSNVNISSSFEIAQNPACV
jgi:hypothetical protein